MGDPKDFMRAAALEKPEQPRDPTCSVDYIVITSS